jgi:hypothetical protein
VRFLGRLFGVGTRAQIPPEVIPPLPTAEEKAAQYSAELHAVDRELDLIGDKIREFRKLHVVTVAGRGKNGGAILRERFIADEVTARNELQMVWDSLWREVSQLRKERNRILAEGAEMWAQK